MVAPSPRALSISESITLAIAARAAAMRADGLDVISLAAGEPDFGTWTPAAEAGIAAIKNGVTRYTPASGMPKVRAAAARWFERFGLSYEPHEVMVTAGAKPALTMALMALTDPGDHVLLPTPYWPSYPEIVKLVGGVPVDVPVGPEHGFVPDADTLRVAAREHGAKGVMINFPNNPSGAVPTEAQMRAIVDAAADADLWIISDEIYALLVYDGARHVSPAALPGGRERTCVINGGTKSHSMTGWRVGFLAGPADVVRAAGGLQSQAIGNPCSISQQAVLAVCEGDDAAELTRRLEAFDARRRYLTVALESIPGLHLDTPRGAFYAFVDAREACAARGVDDIGLVEQLLTEALVSAVPGSAFTMPGFVRLSYAASMDDLERSVARMREFFAGKV